jgi:hypothetical protein
MTLGAKMSFDLEEDLLPGIRPRDVVVMRTIWGGEDGRYLVVKISRSQKFMDMLPLEPFFSEGGNVEGPVLSVPFSIVKNLEKIDQSNLFFLVDKSNPHIMKVLEGM